MSLNSKTTTVLVTLVLVVFTLILYENGFTSQIAFTPGGSFRAQTVIGIDSPSLIEEALSQKENTIHSTTENIRVSNRENIKLSARENTLHSSRENIKLSARENTLHSSRENLSRENPLPPITEKIVPSTKEITLSPITEITSPPITSHPFKRKPLPPMRSHAVSSRGNTKQENVQFSTPPTIDSVTSKDVLLARRTPNQIKAQAYQEKKASVLNRSNYSKRRLWNEVNYSRLSIIHLCQSMLYDKSDEKHYSPVIHSEDKELQSSKGQDNHDSNWYSLTGRSGPSVNTIQNKMRECSLAMGVSQESLVRNDAAINIIATNISVFLNALSAIIPQQFSTKYRSPCWKSPIVLSEQLEQELSLLSGETWPMMPDFCLMPFIEHLYQSILVPALQSKNESLMCLPAFFLAGFPKGGTTTLNSILFEHNMISRPSRKETQWWARMPLKNMEQDYLLVGFTRYLDYYYGQANSVIREQPQILTYDASQSTLWDSHFLIDNQDYCAMPIVLSHILPSAKFIVVMRDPVARTYSHFVHHCTLERMPLPSSSVFHEKVVANLEYFKNCLLRNQSIFECANDKYFTRPLLAQCGYVGFHLTTSMYYLHLSKWMQFFPRENFLFLRTDDMSSDPYAFMRSITNFLNIDEFPNQTAMLLLTRKRNAQEVNTSLLPETRAILSEFFHPFNEKLVQLIGDKRFLWEDTQY